jgi:hypothetical protein
MRDRTERFPIRQNKLLLSTGAEIANVLATGKLERHEQL